MDVSVGYDAERACAFTGHRPFRFVFKDDENHPLCRKIKAAMADACLTLIREQGVRRFISGCAVGVDQWGAEAVISLRAQYPDIRLVCAAPFPDFVAKWTPEQKQWLRRIWDTADEKGFIRRAYSPEVYFERNRFMVDRAKHLIAVYDRESASRSGTGQTVRYAQGLDRRILYIHPDTGEISR